MTPEFWHQRWLAGQIGFHQQEIHVYLKRYWPRLALAGGERVFVPLCGKSLDMLWLAEQGFRVVGVELSEKAVRDFFEENRLQAVRSTEGALVRWRCDEIELLQGDFFHLAPEVLGDFQAIYDRASLIALPPKMRVDYMRQLAVLCPTRARGLLVTLEYDQTCMDGPPFSVAREEVERLLASEFAHTELEGVDILGDEERFRKRGLNRLIERAYLFHRREV
jgi:thiopurine S-methyltransferase